MCWTTYKEELAKARIADKDIKVFKVCRKINEQIVSFYMGKEYDVGETYRGKFNPSETENVFNHGIKTGFHSYNPENTVIKKRKSSSTFDDEDDDVDWDDFNWIEVFDMDRHHLDHFVKTENVVRVECTIPEGSTYYENENGEIVSDTIRIDSFHDLI